MPPYLLHVLKRAIWRTPLRAPLQRIATRLRTSEAAKHRILLDIAEQYGLRIFIETGTYRGDTVAALAAAFDRVYSIELGTELARQARSRFRGHPHISILHGDSGDILGPLAASLTAPALVWLDAHYSRGAGTAHGLEATPILRELRHILSTPAQHVILIDDARCFGYEPGYPTLRDVRRFIKARWPASRISIKRGIIAIIPVTGQPKASGLEP